MNWERLWYPRQKESFARNLALSPLWALSQLYGAGVGARGAFYDRQWLKPRRVPGVFVVSVGNLTAGGAGKTPAVIFLAQHLLSLGRKVAVLSRGYGRVRTDALRVEATSTEEDVGDEPLLIHRRVPEANVFVGSSRADLAEWAVSLGADTVLLDDGMQHRQLARDLDVLVVDARSGFGNRKMIPRGPLREPLSQVGRAGLLWLRSEAADSPIPVECQNLPVVRAAYEPSEVILEDGRRAPASWLSGKSVFAFGGIARPSSFLRTLESLGAQVKDSCFFKDHHRFRPQEVADLRARAKQASALLCTTEKDSMRLPADFPRLTLRLDVRLLSGHKALSDCLSQRIHSWDKAKAP